MNELLSPHFVNNLFAIMRTLNSRQRQRELDLILVHLNRLLQYCQKPEDIVRLKDELDFTRHYLEIQAYRFGVRMNYIISEGDAENSLVEKYCVSRCTAVFIENSIEPSYDKGFISIKVGRDIRIEMECGKKIRLERVPLF